MAIKIVILLLGMLLVVVFGVVVVYFLYRVRTLTTNNVDLLYKLEDCERRAQLPPIQLPPIQLPPIQLPPIQLPPIQLPPIQLPPIQLPPEYIYLPNMNNYISIVANVPVTLTMFI